MLIRTINTVTINDTLNLTYFDPATFQQSSRIATGPRIQRHLEL